MIPLTSYAGASVGVFGLGKAGRAATEALLTAGARVYAADDLAVTMPAHESLTLASFKHWPWEALRALVLSPGVPLTHPEPHDVVRAARNASCPVIGEVELLQQACPEARKIGITGTNGKSTTTALIGHILGRAGVKVQVGGNLGTPALALEPLGADGIYVLEMSSFQLDLVHSVHFDHAVWLNITPDHLDRHGDMEGYIAAKKHILDHQTVSDTLVIGVDDPYSDAVAQEVIASGKQTVVPMTIGQTAAHGVEVCNGILRDRRDGAEIDLRYCKGLKGAHNWQNAAAAYTVCKAVGISPDIISEAMQSFAGLAHRMEWIGEYDGVAYVNDSKATNADSAARALAAYPEDIYWIAGGRAKEGGISALGAFFPRIAHAYLIGEAEEAFAATLEGHVPYSRCATLDIATRKASADARRAKRGVVLLSPACASWDQWPNFEARGDAFRDYVKSYASDIHSEEAI